jgi:hypothetical protein
MVNGYPVAEFSSGNRLAEPTFQFGYKPGRPQRSPDASQQILKSRPTVEHGAHRHRSNPNTSKNGIRRQVGEVLAMPRFTA